MSQRAHQEVAAYYDQELATAQATGAGLIWFMGHDHLSPPLSNDDYYALDSSHWRQASSNRVVDLARHMGIATGEHVVELGCGIGGPGRDVATATGATVLGLSISIEQLKNLRRLSEDAASPYMSVIKGDMQRLPLADGSMDHVYSINAIYHVNDPYTVIDESHRTLKDGGRFGVDDWFTTEQTTPEQLSKLRHNWSTGSNGFHNIDRFVGATEAAGFHICETVDYTGEAGAFLSEERFGNTYDDQIAPVLLDAFPKLYQYQGYEPAHAEMAVEQLRSDILYMGTLYRSGAAVYRQIIAEK